MADDGIFIKVLPQLEMAAFASVMGQLQGIMGKAGADMSKSFDGPQKALADLNAEVVKTSNAVADSSARMDDLQTKAARASESRANVEATSAERQAKAAADIEAAEIKLDATRERNFASQEGRMAALATAQNRLDVAIAKSAQVERDTALTTATALDTEATALGRVTKQEADLDAARVAHTASVAAHTDALAASSTMLGKYGDALGTAGMAATAAFGVIGGVGIDAATKFETGMTRIQVAGQVSTQQVQILSQGLLDMSASMGVGMDKLQEASLMISKSGPQYKDAADNLEILRSGIELSKTEGADLTTVVQQMTTSMNDFSMGAGSAGDVAAKFQTAAANAKRPLEEFVGALHNIEPAAMGVLDSKTGLNQVLTVMSQMAGTGAGIDQASANLNNFLSHLNVPNAPQRSVLGSLGLDSTALSEQLKSPNGLITVLGELREAMAKVTTGTGANAVTHLGDGLLQNPALARDMQTDYNQLSPYQKTLADQFKSANAAGLPVDKDVMREMRAAGGTSGMLKDWYTKFLQTTGPSNLVKAGLDPNMSPAMAIQYATGSQAGDRSFLGIMGDVSNPNDEHWQNTQKTLGAVAGSGPDAKGDVPGWSDILNTNKQKLDELNASLRKLAIEVGEDLLPAFKSFIDYLTGATHFLSDHKFVLDGVVGSLTVLATLWSGSKILSIFMTAQEAVGRVALAFTGIGTASTEAATTVEQSATKEIEANNKVRDSAIQTGTAFKEQIGSGAEAGANRAVTAFGRVADKLKGIASLAGMVGTQFLPSNDGSEGAVNGIAGLSWLLGPEVGLPATGAAGLYDFLLKPAYDGAQKDEQLKDQKRKQLAQWDANAPKGTSLSDLMLGGGGTPLGSGSPLQDILATPHADPNTPAPGPTDAPAGTPSDPVQVQIPGFDPSASTQSSFDPSSFASDLGSSMGVGDMSMAATMNPLEQIKGGGFTLPNITKVLTTFLMEMALGNPLGHLLTGTSMFGGQQQGADGTDPTGQVSDIDKMTAGQRKQAEMELQMQSALAKYKKAQAAYVQAVTKYGSGSEQGISAYANLLSAKDNVMGTELRQTDSVSKGNADLATAQATVQHDLADQLNVADPAKYQSDLAKLTKIQNSLPGDATPGSGTNWDKIAGGGQYGPMESSGNWQNADTGNNGHFGGLQIAPATWQQFGGTQFAPMPQDASEAEQKTVADRILNGWNNNGQIVPGQGSAAWSTWGQSGFPTVAPGGQGTAPAASPGLAPGAAAPAAPFSLPSVTPGPTLPGILGQIFHPSGGGGGGGGGGPLGMFGLPQGLPTYGLGDMGSGASGYTGGSLMPGANVTYTPDWMIQHGFPALFQRNSGTGDATNIPPAIQALAKQFGMTVNDHPDTTLHGGQAGKGNTLNPMGGWGFDFYGNEGQMEALAQYEEQAQNIGNVAQLIHRGGGQDWGVAGGQNVGGPQGQGSYYNTGQGYNVHGDHDHIAFAQMPSTDGYPAGYTDPSTWGVNRGAGGQGFLGGISQGGPPPGPGGGQHMAGSGVGGVNGNFGAPMTPSNTAGPTAGGSGPGVSVGGGMLGTAESLASTALNAIAPGAGIAAQIGMQELNNVASYVGKAAGIGIEGLQETFSVHSPDTNDGSKSGGWLGKIAGGLAGGHPQAQNTAGTAAPVAPKDPSTDQGTGTGTTNNYNVTNNNHGVTDPQGIATKTNQGLMQYPTSPS